MSFLITTITGSRASSAEMWKRMQTWITKEELGDIMITGATGFLGIHILKAYLDNYDGKVYCLVRKGSMNPWKNE